MDVNSRQRASPEANSASSGKTLATCALFLLLTFLVYSPVWKAEFLWDDEFLVLHSSFIRSPLTALEGFRHFLFSHSRGEFYRPVQNVSYLFDYWRAGLEPGAFHVSNLLIHGINGILAFFLATRILRKIGDVTEQPAFVAAFFTAGAWLLHPVHSAVTAYVSGRADSLALAGMLGSWLCWEKALDPASRMGKLLSAAAYFLALAACCSKEIALSGLALFVAYLWLFRKEITLRAKTITTLGVFTVLCCYLLLRQLPDPNSATPAAAVISPLEKGNLFIRAMGDYARLAVFPQQLFMERQVSIPTGLFNNPVVTDPLFPYLGWLGVLTMAIVGASLIWRAPGRRLRCLGALWFAMMIFPVSNLFTLNASVAEHWLYIPLLGILFWLAGCWIAAAGSLQRASVFLLPVALVALVALAWRTYLRAGDWKDPMTFYHATVRAGGDSVRMRLNLAGEYQKRGNLAAAERIYRSVVHVLPQDPLANGLLALNLAKQGTAGAISPLPDPRAAAVQARLAYEAQPDSWQAVRSLAMIFQAQSQPLAALEVLNQFATRNPWHADAHLELARLCETLNQPERAAEAYRQAARLDIRDVVSRDRAVELRQW